MSRTVLVTGASSGIGRAVALLAGQKGYRVAVHYRGQRERAEQLVASLRGLGAQAVALQADLAKPEQVVTLYEAVDREFGRLDAVVNSAGIGLRASPVAELASDRVEALLATNVLGVIVSCREASRRLSTARGGRGGVIINLSSMAATIGGRPGSAAYAASKAAVDAFTVGFAKEVAAEGIRAISLRPGVVDTEMTRDNLQTPAFAATVRASVPLGRPAHVDEVAKPILWLLGDEASFITGACIDVSGGGFRIASASA